jgi:hypothetical protein
LDVGQILFFSAPLVWWQRPERDAPATVPSKSTDFFHMCTAIFIYITDSVV